MNARLLILFNFVTFVGLVLFERRLRDYSTKESEAGGRDLRVCGRLGPFAAWKDETLRLRVRQSRFRRPFSCSSGNQS